MPDFIAGGPEYTLTLNFPRAYRKRMSENAGEVPVEKKAQRYTPGSK
jgi:hypothetical protein